MRRSYTVGILFLAALALQCAYAGQPQPTVTSILPTSGSSLGGTSGTVRGTGFVAGATLTIGGVTIPGATVASANTINFTTPANGVGMAPGAANVIVTNTDAQFGTLPNGFTFIAAPAPTITSVVQNNGQSSGGTGLTISGTNFVAGATVDFGGFLATGVVVTANSIQAVTPTHAPGNVNVTVTNPDTQAAVLLNGFTFTAALAPTIASISPTSGTSLGDQNVTVTITGNNFDPAATVDLGGVSVPLAGASQTVITFNLPAHAPGIVNVRVTNPDTQAGILTNGFEFNGIPAPSVTSLNITSGSSLGGTTVSITGANFVAGATVDFGGSAATAVNVTGPNNITATTTGHAPGAADVTVTLPDTQFSRLPAGFSFTAAAAPTVGSILPTTGTTFGGTAVTITGTNFAANATVKFDNIPAKNVVVASATSITAITPLHAPGTADVVVVNADGQSGRLAGGFTYNGGAAPAITGINPASGSTLGGNTVTISGSNFTASATVDFGGSLATRVSVAANGATMTVTTPAHASGAVTVTVTNPDTQKGTFSSFTFNVPAAPTVTSIAPTNGPSLGGTAVTITGTNFVGSTVDFGGIAATGVNVANSTTITAISPAHAPDIVDVTVTNGDTQFAALPLAFTFNASPAPVVSSVAANSGPSSGGNRVTITGTNFDLSANNVDFGGQPGTGITVVSTTRIDVFVPPHAPGAVSVTVTNPDTQGGFLANGYTYTAAPAPSITSVGPPTSGTSLGGTAVTITGTNFNTGTRVFFGGISAFGIVTFNSATSLTAITPAHAPGIVGVMAVNPDTQSGTLPASFTFTAAPAPTVTAINPASGLSLGGLRVVITGTNFAPGATVTLGGVPATNVNVANATTLTAITPVHAGSAIPVNVVVTNPDTQSATLAGSFTYNAAPSPVITGIAPPNGASLGGATVTISGFNFFLGATVDFGGRAATRVGVTSNGNPVTSVNTSGNAITVTTPAHAPGLVSVTVTNTDGQFNTFTNSYTYDPAPQPSVTSVSPNIGPLAGGQRVAIRGTNFAAGVTVSFGGVTTNANFLSPALMTARTPPSSVSGPVDVKAVNPDGQTGTLANGYTYSVTPSFAALNPNSGPSSGGTFVTITGSNFIPGATVSLGGTAALNVTVVSSATITLNTPAHAAGAVDVVITNPGSPPRTIIGGFTFTAPPTVTAISPNNGPAKGGTAVTITGTGFVAGATVSIGGVAATQVTVVNTTTLTATTGAHAAGTVDVVVTVSGQPVTLAAAFTYNPPPTAIAIAPNNGAPKGGTAVTITGTGFVAGASVSIGGVAATQVLVVNATTITAKTGPHAVGTVDVVVTNGDGQIVTLTAAFTYNAPPTLTAIAPNNGSPAGGNSVTLTGTGFTAGASVSIGGVAATQVTVVNATTITAKTGPHTPGTVDVVLTNGDGQIVTLAAAFTYNPPPTLIAITPNNGTPAGGNSVTLTGTGFTAGASVSIGGVAATQVTVVNAATITAKTGPHAPGTVDVVVTNGDGQIVTLAAAFSYNAPPTVAAITPLGGPTAGGAVITISGSGFIAGATVSIGGVAATQVTVVNAATLTAATGAHVAGIVDVVVSNPDGQGATLAAAYRYADPPVIVSPLTPPNAGPIYTGQLVVFPVPAVDPQGLPLTITYDYGDGVSDTLGKHIYLLPGNYTVTITISNGFATATQSLTFTVLAKLPMKVNKLQGAVNFAATGKDTCQLLGIIPAVPAKFNPKDQVIAFDIGGVPVSFVLDAKGQSKVATGSAGTSGNIMLKLKLVRNKATKTKEFVGGDVKYQLRLKGDFAAGWKQDGIDPALTVKKQTITMAIDMTFNGNVYTATVTPVQSSRATKNARFTFIQK